MRVTNHAIERYSQRILGRTNDTIRTMPTEEVEKIRHQIEGCISDENKVYDDLPYCNDNGDVTLSDIYVCENIVPIFDKKTQAVITIYNIDLGFDDKINQKYAKIFKKKINDIKSNTQKNIDEYTTKIRKCTDLIADHQDEIKRLEEEIEKHKSAVKSITRIRGQYYDERKNQEQVADESVKALVTTMIKRK